MNIDPTAVANSLDVHQCQKVIDECTEHLKYLSLDANPELFWRQQRIRSLKTLAENRLKWLNQQDQKLKEQLVQLSSIKFPKV